MTKPRKLEVTPKSEPVCLRPGTFGSDPDSTVSLSFSMTVADAWRFLIPDVKEANIDVVVERSPTQSRTRRFTSNWLHKVVSSAV